MIISTKRWACFISAALIVLTSANLQAQHEIGVKLHTVNFMGDFGGGGLGTVFLKDVNVQPRPWAFPLNISVILPRSYLGKTVSAPFQSTAMISIPGILFAETGI